MSLQRSHCGVWIGPAGDWGAAGNGSGVPLRPTSAAALSYLTNHGGQALSDSSSRPLWSDWASLQSYIQPITNTSGQLLVDSAGNPLRGN